MLVLKNLQNTGGKRAEYRSVETFTGYNISVWHYDASVLTRSKMKEERATFDLFSCYDDPEFHRYDNGEANPWHYYVTEFNPLLFNFIYKVSVAINIVRKYFTKTLRKQKFQDNPPGTGGNREQDHVHIYTLNTSNRQWDIIIKD